MKLNLFNGIIIFEGSMTELKGVMDEMETMTQKLIDLQLRTNDAIIQHQEGLARIEATKAKNGQRPPTPGYQQ